MQKMNQMELAQLFKADRKKFLEKAATINKSVFSCCVADGPPETYGKKEYGGYNCLHSAGLYNLDVVEKLLDEGADFLKQGTRDGKTPLHNFARPYIFEEPLQLIPKEISNIEVINAVLSAQVIRNRSENVRCKNGMTHLHIASIANHKEAVALFVKAGVHIDEQIYFKEFCTAGYTALHFAIKHSSVDAAKILIVNKANIYKNDARGISPLALLIDRLLALQSLMCMGHNIVSRKYQREIEMLEDIAQSILNYVQPHHVNSVDSTGLSTFYLACSLADTSYAAKFLTVNNVNTSVSKDSQLWPGWTPLHFAACSSVQTVKLLLQNGACISAKNARGESPLDFFMMRCNPEVVHSILLTKIDIKDMFLSDGVTKLLDLLLAMYDSDALNNFLQSLPDVNASVPMDSPVWPGCNALHLAIKSNEKNKIPEKFFETYQSDSPVWLAEESFEKYQDSSSVLSDSSALHATVERNDSSISSDSSALDSTDESDETTKTHEELHETKDVESEYLKRISVCLARSCSVNAKNADDLSPIHLAFYMRKDKVVDLMMDNCHDNTVDSKNASILHVACATGKVDVVERLVNGGADANSRTTDSFECYYRYEKKKKLFILLAAANSTPLHLAVIFGHHDIVKLLLRKGADAYAKNVYGLTPIHVSMACWNDSTYTAKFLLQLVSDLKESVSNDGLTHLHVAAFADDEKSIDKLIQQGLKSIDEILQEGSESCSNINAVFNAKARDLRPKNGEPASEVSLLYERYSESTPLYAAVLKSSGNATRALLQNGGALCVEIVKRYHLLREVMTSSKYYMEFTNNFLEVLKRDDRVGAIDSSGITLLHIASAVQDLEWAKELLEKGANANAQISGLYVDDGIVYEDPFDGTLREKDCWAGVTPLRAFIDRALWARTPANVVKGFVQLLIDYGLDVTMRRYDGSALHMIYDIISPNPTNDFCTDEALDDEQAEAWTFVTDLLLEKHGNYAVNPIDKYGFSHFHIACLRNKVDIVKKFLDNGVDVNHFTDPFFWGDTSGFTALHFAFSQKSEEVARLLIERGADVKAENANGDTPLHIALANGVTDLKIFEMMLSKGADINAQSIFCSQKPLTCYLSSSNITFKVLNFFLKKGAIIDAIGNINTSIGIMMKSTKAQDRQVILSSIIKRCKIRSAIKNGFNAIESIVAVDQERELTLKYYIHTIQMFIQMGCQIDWQNAKGKTALHEAVSRYNVQAIEALLLLGANIDIADNENKPPFTARFVKSSYMDNELNTFALSILSKHVWKKKFVELEVHRSSEEAMYATFRKMPLKLKWGYKIRCMKELEKLWKTAICENLTMKDFLYGSGVVNRYPTLSFFQREAIRKFFKNANRLRHQFPEFVHLLTMQNRKALQRDKLYQPSKQALAKILKIQLPDICSENVLKYFENVELIRMIEIVE